MNNPIQAVTAYTDTNKGLHATKSEALISSISLQIEAQRRACYETGLPKWDVEKVLSAIFKSDDARRFLKEAIEDKDYQRTKELTEAFCNSSKTC